MPVLVSFIFQCWQRYSKQTILYFSSLLPTVLKDSTYIVAFIAACCTESRHLYHLVHCCMWCCKMNLYPLVHFLWKVSLKILNSGIIIKTVIHVITWLMMTQIKKFISKCSSVPIYSIFHLFLMLSYSTCHFASFH